MTARHSEKSQMRFIFRDASLYRLLKAVTTVCGPTTSETNELKRIPSLFAWRSGAREEFEVKDDREAIAAFGGRPKGDP
jgi:hypothetical protein